MSKRLPYKRQLSETINFHLLEQKKSHQTIKEYCKVNDICVQTFYTWRKRFKKHNLPVIKNEPVLSPIPFTSLGTLNTQIKSTPLFDIRYYSGTSVSVYRGTTADELAPFLGLLSGGKTQC